MRVRVYKNLHNGLWSVKSMEKDFHYNRVIAHVSKIFGRDAEFIVQEKGRQKVIAEGRKNVHAFVQMEAILVGKKIVWYYGAGGSIPVESEFFSFQDVFAGASDIDKVTYNPYENSQFMLHRRNENLREIVTPIKQAKKVVFTYYCEVIY